MFFKEPKIFIWSSGDDLTCARHTHTYMKRTVYTVCENCKKKNILQKTNNLLLSQNKLFKKVDFSL